MTTLVIQSNYKIATRLPRACFAFARQFSATARASQASVVHPASPRVHVHTIPENRTTPSSNLKYALSFLQTSDFPAKKSVFDHPDLIIGWTPEQTSLDPKSFVDNNEFIQFMTKVLKTNIHKVNDSALKGLAEWQKEGWLHVADERNPPPWGRIPFPEDIIGSVLIKDGVIQPDTFEAMPTHRLVTSYGIFKLSEPLFQCLLQESKKKAQEQ